MIRLWKPSDEPALKALWRDTFGDPDVYIDKVIFKYKTAPESIMLFESGGKLISAVHMPRSGFNFWGKELSAAYVMGVATDKSERGHGYMRPLMNNALKSMYDSDTSFCTLIPAEGWLYDYYAGFGFTEAFYLKKDEVYINKSGAFNEEVSESRDDEALYRFYRDYFRDEPFYIKKSLKDLKAVLTDHRLGKGRVLIHKTNGRIDGACFVISDSGGCLVKELCASENKVRGALLSYAASLYDTEKLKMISRPRNAREDGAYRRGMIRAVSVFDVLGAYAAAHEEESLALSVKDDNISVNTGVYRLSDGVVSKISDEAYDEALSPAEVMRFVLKGQTCYMNLMLD
ncbi:MAG: GNAT family N-acetyltransferase [Clostridia bacterium]|nr:GNAT family N-acetyltransferase [Clostridia bacterium]